MTEVGWIDVGELARGGAVLKTGDLCVFPTDTVYGVGCKAGDMEGIRRLRALKDRPRPAPFSLHVGSIADGLAFVGTLSTWQRAYLERWLPGPVTVLLPAGDLAPEDACMDGKVGLRVPGGEGFRLVYEAFGPLFGTSVNRRGEAPLGDMGAMRDAFGGDVDVWIAGREAVSEIASAVVDLCGEQPVAVRGSLPEDGA